MNIVRSILIFLFICLCSRFSVAAAEPDMIYKPFIRTVQLFKYGYQLALPIYTLNSADRLELEFDDMEGSLKNYYYSYVLCDYNWQPVDLNPLDYLKGFTQNRINTYRYSSIAFTRYTHYQAILPERNSMPTRSGNYLLKVFLDGDPSKVVFTRRMYVLEEKAIVSAEVVQPFSPQHFNTHQKVKFSVSTKNLYAFSLAQQVKVVILQNNRWDNALKDIPPTFVRGTTLEYNSENIAIMEAGKEWRWLDLRSFRLQSDRVQRANYNKTSTDIFVKPDEDRRAQRYLYFPDYNGQYVITTYETINPFWQGDYATVHFYFAPPNGEAYPKKDLYIGGGFTGFELSDKWKLKYNEETKLYEITAFMKQGYYSYAYFLTDESNTVQKTALEGNYWETENSYTILIYYKAFTDRSDQLIGVAHINSRKDTPGYSF